MVIYLKLLVVKLPHFKDNKALILTPISKGVLFKMKSGWFINISFLINNDLYRLNVRLLKIEKRMV